MKEAEKTTTAKATEKLKAVSISFSHLDLVNEVIQVEE